MYLCALWHAHARTVHRLARRSQLLPNFAKQAAPIEWFKRSQLLDRKLMHDYLVGHDIVATEAGAIGEP